MSAALQPPRIVRFVEVIDAPGSTCPHCGAEGRYILRFVVEDGRTLGAMRGCAKLFPVSPVAREEQRLREKAARYAKNGWQLNRVDSAALDACEAFAAGRCSADEALVRIQQAKKANTARYRRAS